MAAVTAGIHRDVPAAEARKRRHVPERAAASRARQRQGNGRREPESHSPVGARVIDWQHVCLQLRRNYKSLHAIAREIDSCGRHLTRLARGEVQQPRFDVGMKLVELYGEHCLAGETETRGNVDNQQVRQLANSEGHEPVKARRRVAGGLHPVGLANKARNAGGAVSNLGRGQA